MTKRLTALFLCLFLLTGCNGTIADTSKNSRPITDYPPAANLSIFQKPDLPIGFSYLFSYSCSYAADPFSAHRVYPSVGIFATLLTVEWHFYC